MKGQFPPLVSMDLPEWELKWFCLRAEPEAGASLDAIWGAEHERLRQRLGNEALAEVPMVAAMRRLFRAAGCDPTRYRPSSEALARRVLKGQLLPRIHPFVDLNNLLSLRVLAPCCVVDPEALEPPLVFRTGAADERMLSMRGEFALGGKPLLADRQGPFGTPITDSERVKIRGGTDRCWLVVYLPALDRAVTEAEQHMAVLTDLCGGLELLA